MNSFKVTPSCWRAACPSGVIASVAIHASTAQNWSLLGGKEGGKGAGREEKIDVGKGKLGSGHRILSFPVSPVDGCQK